MTIPLSQRYAMATGEDTDFSERAIVMFHRHSTFVLNNLSPTGGELAACNAVWQNVSNYRFPVSLALLNGPLVNEEDWSSISDLDLEGAVSVIWPTFVSVYFPDQA